jgi:hypothetical protein
MLAPLTPEEERQLAAMQQQLAAPQPTPTPAPGPALAAMAPTPAPTPEPIGPALAATEPRRSNASLAAYISAGGNDFRSIYPNLAPEEQAFIDGMRSGLGSSGQMTTERELMLKALDTHLKSYRSSNIQTLTTSDGRQVSTWNGQIIPDNSQEPKRELISGEGGMQYFADPSTSTATVITQGGQPVRKEARLSPSQINKASLSQSLLDASNSKFQMLNGLPETAKVSWDENNQTYSQSMFGTSVKAEREKLLREQSTHEKTLESILTPPSRPSPTPSPTPDQFQVGKPYRDANGNVKTYRGNGNWE